MDHVPPTPRSTSKSEDDLSVPVKPTKSSCSINDTVIRQDHMYQTNSEKNIGYIHTNNGGLLNFVRTEPEPEDRLFSKRYEDSNEFSHNKLRYTKNLQTIFENKANQDRYYWMTDKVFS